VKKEIQTLVIVPEEERIRRVMGMNRMRRE
jgi:hypothetical protein